jgi:hypothetical protein
MNPWEEMDKIVKLTAEPKGPEWFTKRQFMAHYRVSYTCATNRINKMIDADLLEEWTGMLSNRSIGKKWKLK